MTKHSIGSSYSTQGVFMFWLIFAVLVSFIIFLVVILFASQSSSNRNLENLKGEVEEKKKRKKPTATKAKAKKEKVKKEKPKEESVEPPVAVAEPEVPVVEVPPVVEPEPTVVEPEPVTVTPEPTPVEVVPEVPVAEPVVEPEVPAVEEAVVEVEEVVEVTASEEAAVDESYDYPPFDHSRTMEEFGLDADEAGEFIQELIKQVDDVLPDLEAAVAAQDEKQIEELSHMIKGSATNLGTGGMADVLVDFNTYVKEEHDPAVIAQHMKNLHHAQKELKAQFS